MLKNGKPDLTQEKYRASFKFLAHFEIFVRHLSSLSRGLFCIDLWPVQFFLTSYYLEFSVEKLNGKL